MKSRRSRTFWTLTSLLLLGIAVYIFWPKGTLAAPSPPSGAGAAKTARKKGGAAAGPPATPVAATRAIKGDIAVYFTGLGAVTPIYTVTLKTRVDGELTHVLYREGQIVQKGDLLIEIDARPYEAQLTQLEGQLMRDQATLTNARLDLTRYETLIKQNAVPEQQLATQRATVGENEGTVKADQGQIDGVKLNIAYCHVTAPITGRTGLRLVDPGNIVHASDATGLVTITQINPISVIFTVAEDQLPQVLQKLRAGRTLTVDAYDREMQRKLAQGTLTTVDNQIDDTTGTVRIRATFDNRNETLFPNQFVNTKLLLEVKRGVVLLPSAAIQRSTNATFVYLVKPDSTVTVRNITVGTTEGDNSEITSGLSPGDVVVMTGADKLLEGSRVEAQIAGEPQQSKGSPR